MINQLTMNIKKETNWCTKAKDSVMYKIGENNNYKFHVPIEYICPLGILLISL